MAKKAYVQLLNIEGKPIRITPESIRRAMGVRRWVYITKLVKISRFFNEMKEDIDSFRVRKIRWAIEEMIKQGRRLTVYKIQIFAGFGDDNKDIKKLIMDVLDEQDRV